MIKYLSLGLLFAVLLISFASAEDDTLGTFKQYECVNLMQTCGNCTFVNISSVLYPNTSIALSNVVMTKRNTFYNYTFCNTQEIGNYRVNGFGDSDPTVYETFSYIFTVTPAGGIENSMTIFLVLIIAAIVILVMGFMFKNLIFTVLSGFAFMGAGVYTMIYGFANISSFYTRMISLFIIGLGFIISIASSLDLMNESYGSDGGNWEDEE